MSIKHELWLLRLENRINELEMSLEKRIEELTHLINKESQFRNADYELIEKLEKRIRDLEGKMPKKRGRPRKGKLKDEDFE
jgi:predicted Holliday junction resolvase-like endonuclease